jgi:hypothetical protein
MKAVPLFALFLMSLAITTAAATSNYAYKRGEYAIVNRGMSPDGKHSIAAHGDGELGYDNFHIYLMAEPGRRKIGPLEEIAEILDTGYEAYDANWSADSRFVAIAYRESRHIAVLNIYRVEARRAYPVAGPSLRQAAGIGDESEVRSSAMSLEWIAPERFRLTESGILLTARESAAKFGKYVSDHEPAVESAEDGRAFVDYHIEAECELSGDRYKIVRLSP